MKGATKAWHGQPTKTAKIRILCTYPTWDFERRSGDSKVQTIGATQGAHGQSTEICQKQLLYEIGVTAAPHPVPRCKDVHMLATGGNPKYEGRVYINVKKQCR